MSPYILEQFEKWAGYKFRPEYIVDQGYHNCMFRVPSRQFLDFIEFQQIEVCALAKELVDIVHSYGKEAMMFLGDHWIGTEPYGKYFAGIGLDAVVGSVGSGVTLRMISDIKGVDYTEGRLLPYFSRMCSARAVTRSERQGITGVKQGVHYSGLLWTGSDMAVI